MEEALQVAENYRLVALRMHKKDKDFENAIAYYKRAVRILEGADKSHVLTRSQYFARLLLQYGNALLRAGLEKNAKEQFRKAEHIG